MYFNLKKSSKIKIIETKGTETTIPQIPNIPPPIIIEIKTAKGFKPVESPISFGANILFSAHCIMMNKIETQRAFNGASINANKTAGTNPKNGPI